MDYHKYLNKIKALFTDHSKSADCLEITGLSANYVVKSALNQDYSDIKPDLEKKLKSQQELKEVNSDEFATGLVKYLVDNRKR